MIRTLLPLALVGALCVASYTAGKRHCAADLAAAQDLLTQAEQSYVAARTGLQLSLAQCEYGRIVDTRITQQALADAADARNRIDAAADQARSTLNTRLAGSCADWGNAPACGITADMLR